jgi:hypothetical protein
VLPVLSTPFEVIEREAELSPWVPDVELRRILAEAPADNELLNDLGPVRAGELD